MTIRNSGDSFNPIRTHACGSARGPPRLGSMLNARMSGTSTTGPLDREMRSIKPVETAELLGLTFDLVTMKEAVSRCLEMCCGPRASHTIITINASHLCTMRRDPKLTFACGSGDLTVADGMSIVWALRVLGQHVPERVA